MESVVVSGVRALFVGDRAVLEVYLDRPALAVGVLADALAGAPGVDDGRLFGELDIVAERIVLMMQFVTMCGLAWCGIV